MPETQSPTTATTGASVPNISSIYCEDWIMRGFASGPPGPENRGMTFDHIRRLCRAIPTQVHHVLIRFRLHQPRGANFPRGRGTACLPGRMRIFSAVRIIVEVAFSKSLPIGKSSSQATPVKNRVRAKQQDLPRSLTVVRISKSLRRRPHNR